MVCFSLTKSKLYTILIVIATLAVAGFFAVIVYKKQAVANEHFTDGDGSTTIPLDYNSRLTVMNVFDAYLKRNPTTDEINKYSKLKNEQDILTAVIKDFPNAQRPIDNTLDIELLNGTVDEEAVSVSVEEPFFEEAKTNMDYVKVKRSDLQLFLTIADQATNKIKELLN